MGTMTARAPRRRIAIRTYLDIEGMDREDLIVESIHRAPELESVLDIDWVPDDATCRRVGWTMACRTGTDFRIGHRLLQLIAFEGVLLPPTEYQLSRQTDPNEAEMYHAPLVHPWQIQLWQSGSTPAEWRLNGSVYHPKWEPRIWCRILYLNRPKEMALTADGWVKLGKRMGA